jgi:hypothetical protein
MFHPRWLACCCGAVMVAVAGFFTVLVFHLGFPYFSLLVPSVGGGHCRKLRTVVLKRVGTAGPMDDDAWVPCELAGENYHHWWEVG